MSLIDVSPPQKGLTKFYTPHSVRLNKVLTTKMEVDETQNKLLGI